MLLLPPCSALSHSPPSLVQHLVHVAPTTILSDHATLKPPQVVALSVLSTFVSSPSFPAPSIAPYGVQPILVLLFDVVAGLNSPRPIPSNVTLINIPVSAGLSALLDGLVSSLGRIRKLRGSVSLA